MIKLSQRPLQQLVTLKKNGERFSCLKNANYFNKNSWAAKHLVKNGQASTALEILPLFKIMSVARIQVPFFRVEAKVSLELPTE